MAVKHAADISNCTAVEKKQPAVSGNFLTLPLSWSWGFPANRFQHLKQILCALCQLLN